MSLPLVIFILMGIVFSLFIAFLIYSIFHPEAISNPLIIWTRFYSYLVVLKSKHNNYLILKQEKSLKNKIALKNNDLVKSTASVCSKSPDWSHPVATIELAHDVFISHSSKDKTIADAACACLESRGIRCWVAPRDIVAGVDWGSSIIDGINGTKVMVLILSSHSNVSKQVLREIERAAHRGMPVLPLRVEDVTLSKSLEYFLSSSHWLDAYKGPLKQHLENLANNTAILLEKRDAVHPLSDSPSLWQRFALRPMIITGVSTALLTVAAGLGIAWYILKDTPADGLKMITDVRSEGRKLNAHVGIAGEPRESVTNSIGMKLIELPAGKFTIGSPAGEKDHQANEEQVAVTLTKPFLLGKYEVTQGQWNKVMGTEPWLNRGNNVQIGEDNAATYVDWNDATAFCRRLTDLERKAGELKAGESYRLPTEAEWEYACRAGTTTAYSFGDDEKQLGEYAWFDSNTAGEQYTHKVGLKKSNPWGLHDMHGNVAEWCSDWYYGKLIGGTDPVVPEWGSFRVFRGGDWWSRPSGCRTASRLSSVPSDRNFGLGFRVARSQSVQ